MQRDSEAMDEIEAWRQLVGLEELQAMKEREIPQGEHGSRTLLIRENGRYDSNLFALRQLHHLER